MVLTTSEAVGAPVQAHALNEVPTYLPSTLCYSGVLRHCLVAVTLMSWKENLCRLHLLPALPAGCSVEIRATTNPVLPQ